MENDMDFRERGRDFTGNMGDFRGKGVISERKDRNFTRNARDFRGKKRDFRAKYRDSRGKSERFQCVHSGISCYCISIINYFNF